MDPHRIAEKAHAHLLSGHVLAPVGCNQDGFDAHPTGILIHGGYRKNGARPVGNAKQILDSRVG